MRHFVWLAALTLLLACDQNTQEPDQKASPSSEEAAASAPAQLKVVDSTETGRRPGGLAESEAAVGAQPRAAAKSEATSTAAAPSGKGMGRNMVPKDFNLKVLANGRGTQRLHTLVGADSDPGVKAAIVAFVASWCSRCKASYPTLESLQKQYGEELKVLLITTDSTAAARARMVQILKDRQITLPLLEADEAFIDHWLGAKKNIPRFYLIDYTGKIRVMDTGFGSKMKKLLPNQVAWLMKRSQVDRAGSKG